MNRTHDIERRKEKNRSLLCRSHIMIHIYSRSTNFGFVLFRRKCKNDGKTVFSTTMKGSIRRNIRSIFDIDKSKLITQGGIFTKKNSTSKKTKKKFETMNISSGEIKLRKSRKQNNKRTTAMCSSVALVERLEKNPRTWKHVGTAIARIGLAWDA